MSELLLLTILVAILAAPAWAARAPTSRQGVRRAIGVFMVTCVAYALGIAVCSEP
jgi:hypothetical protein